MKREEDFKDQIVEAARLAALCFSSVKKRLPFGMWEKVAYMFFWWDEQEPLWLASRKNPAAFGKIFWEAFVAKANEERDELYKNLHFYYEDMLGCPPDPEALYLATFEDGAESIHQIIHNLFFGLRKFFPDAVLDDLVPDEYKPHWTYTRAVAEQREKERVMRDTQNLRASRIQRRAELQAELKLLDAQLSH